MDPAEVIRLVENPPIDPGSLRPTKTWGVRSVAEAAAITERDVRFLAFAPVFEDGLIPGLKSYNWLLLHGFKQIFREQFHIQKRFENRRKTEPEIRAIDFELRFVDVEVGEPTHDGEMGTAGVKLPAHARVERGTAGDHNAPLKVKVEATLTAVTSGEPIQVSAAIDWMTIGRIPILVRSVKCPTHTMPPSALRLAGEDPADPGGYAIIGGNEYSVEITENIIYNIPLMYLRPKTGVAAKVTFISQAGGAFDNSSQVTVQQLTGGGITIDLSSQQRLKSENIPFYLIYRMLGAATDREAVATVVFGEGVDGGPISPAAQQMLDWVGEAYAATYKGFEELLHVTAHRDVVLEASKRLVQEDEGAAKDDTYRYQHLLGVFDAQFIPHVGTGPESRPAKLRLLGLMIRRLFQVRMGVLAPTDRDSFEHKRVHDAGITVAKALRRTINDGVIKPLIKSVRNYLEQNSLAEIRPVLMADQIRNFLAKGQLTKNISQAITSGYQAKGRGRSGTARTRLKSQALERKNPLNTAATLRTIHTQGGDSTKHTQRGTDRRQVQAASTGFIGPLRSADTGANVGMTKEQAISTKFSREEDPALLSAALRADPDVVSFEDSGYAPYVQRDDGAPTFTIVFVNGKWIGGTADPGALVRRYRRLRREGRVVPASATVCWSASSGGVIFHVDAGRILRPLMIVDNNQEAFDAAARAGKPIPFVQAPAVTVEHLTGLRTGKARLDDLVAAGVVEWIAPEEQANALIAPELNVLRAARHNPLRAYTHVDIPFSLLSLTALANIFTEFSQPARGTYSTNQMRQACAQFIANPHGPRLDNGRFFMFNVQDPLVRGVGHAFVPPGGLNVPVAYMSYRGQGQEDSVIGNGAAFGRGAYGGLYFAVARADKGSGEQFVPPDPARTAHLRPDTFYGDLEPSGFPSAGTILEPGSAIIGVVGQNDGPDQKTHPFVDKSRVYKRDEPARVVKSYPQAFAVKYAIDRGVEVGDKLSSRGGNKGVISMRESPANLPYTADGFCPTLIVNAHSFPTRMILSQLMESLASSAAARRGAPSVDGTIWSGVSLEGIVRDALNSGLSVSAGRQMFDGRSGRPLSGQTHMGLTYYQRLQKYALDERYAAPASGPRNPVSGQPVPGKASGGANRLGEMELWALISQGHLATILEKVWQHSDGLVVPRCRNCGEVAVANQDQEYYTCQRCGDAVDPVRQYSRRSAVTFEHLTGSVVDYRLHPAPRMYVEREPAGAPAPSATGAAAATES
jgi:DNA-directed RNA polymerase II subunit RPB2